MGSKVPVPPPTDQKLGKPSPPPLPPLPPPKRLLPAPGRIGMSVRPCPCCGEGGTLRTSVANVMVGLYLGHSSADSMSVECYTCGLRMVVEIPDDWPANVNHTTAALEQYCLAEAVRRWNRRFS